MAIEAEVEVMKEKDMYVCMYVCACRWDNV